MNLEKRYNKLMKSVLPVLILIVLWAIYQLEAPTAVAQTVPVSDVTVGLHHSPPFVIAGDEGWDGIGVHLWRDIAQELDITYEWQVVAPDAIQSSLRDGSVDVVIGTVTNVEDERVFDFSHPYFVSSLGTAEPAERTIRQVVGAFFSPKFWQISLWLVILFLIVGLLVWLFERHANEEQFGPGTVRGIWAGFWWAGVTMSTIGYGDKVPQTVGGRILGLLWMLVAMGITAILTASLTSILTLNSGLGATQFPGDLRQMTVGTVANSESADFLDEERIQYQPFDRPEAGLEAVRSGELEIFVDDVAMLRFTNNEALQGALRVSASGIHPQQHAFALPADSSLREPINQILLQRIEEPAWQSFVSRYVSESQ